MRLIAFNQLYKILGIERLPDRVLPAARKRPLDTSEPAPSPSPSGTHPHLPSSPGRPDESELAATGKKDKKEEAAAEGVKVEAEVAKKEVAE